MTFGQRILSHLIVGIGELRKHPSRVIEAADGETVAVLKNGRVSAYLVPPATYEWMRDRISASERAD